MTVLERLGVWCARHGLVVLLLWVAVLVVVAAGAATTGVRTTDDFAVPGADSARALELLREELPAQAGVDGALVLVAGRGTVTEAARAAARERTAELLDQVPGVVVAPGVAASAPVSSDQRVTYLPFLLDEPAGKVDEADLDAVLAAAEPARQAGLRPEVGGAVGQLASRPETGASELAGLAAAVVVLLVAFGSAVAMALPVVMALVGLGIGLSLLVMAGHLVELPSTAASLATMIGLGVGIDYALFVVSRHRSQLAAGLSVVESVGRANASSGAAVVFAGVTVVIAISGLAVAEIPLVSAHGYATSVVVALAVLAAITLLPALLGLLGPRMDRLRVPALHRPRSARARAGRSGWEAWAARVARRPWTWASLCLLVILVLAAPAVTLRLGQPDSGSSPGTSTERRAYDALAEGFGAGVNGPLLLAVRLDTPASVSDSTASGPGADPRAGDERLVALASTLSVVDGVAAVSPARLSEDGRTAALTVVPTTAPQDHRTEQLVQELRDQVLPTQAPAGTRVLVGGQTATFIDLAERVSDRLPWFVIGVVLLSCLLLTAVFRSVVIPLQAAVMNVLSIAAALGAVVLVFQEGVGLTLIGLDGAVPIISFVPLMMFAVLFGLSMDYQVFLLAGIREAWLDTGDNTRAVELGLARSGRVITSAALIMIAVFGSFVLSDDPLLKVFGVGLTVAVALDATVIRCALVPAVMVLCGRANWWLPGRTAQLLPPVLQAAHQTGQLGSGGFSAPPTRPR